MRDEGVDDAALVVDGGHRVHAAQQERVVRDDQVGLQQQRLVDDLGDRVDGEQDRGSRVASGSPHARPTASQSEASSGG